jgi:hypothetical protein
MGMKALCVRFDGRVQLIDLGSENKIALGKPVNFVGPGFNFDLSPSEKNIGMMAFLFRDLADAVDEIEGGPEIGKGEALHQVVTIHHLPPQDLRFHVFQFGACERRHAPAAWDAMFLSQAHMSLSYPLRIYLSAYAKHGQ